MPRGTGSSMRRSRSRMPAPTRTPVDALKHVYPEEQIARRAPDWPQPHLLQQPRQQPGYQDMPWRNFDVIGIAPDGKDAQGNQLYTSAVDYQLERSDQVPGHCHQQCAYQAE